MSKSEMENLPHFKYGKGLSKKEKVKSFRVLPWEMTAQHIQDIVDKYYASEEEKRKLVEGFSYRPQAIPVLAVKLFIQGLLTDQREKDIKKLRSALNEAQCTEDYCGLTSAFEEAAKNL